MSTMTVMRPPAAVDHGDHVCALFEADAEQRRALTAFVRAGLAAHDRIWYLADSNTPYAVCNFLRTGGVAVDAALASGQLSVLSAEESYLAHPPFDPGEMIATLHAAIDDALVGGYAGFRVTGEMSWAARDVPGVERQLDYEQRVAEVFATRPAAAVCQYDTRQFDAGMLGAAAELHPQSLLAMGDDLLAVSVLTDRAGLRLDGAVDLAHRDRLRQALAAVPSGSDELHLELAGLLFIDIAGVADLVATTRAHPDLRLVLHDPPPMLRRAIDLFWPGTDLEITGSGGCG